METTEPFAISFGMKSAVEVVIDGVTGILTKGMATLYNLKDQVGEYQVPGGLADVVDTWGRQAAPMVDYDHGLDAVLGTAQIGWGVTYELTPEGLYAECFLPKDPQPPFRHNAVAKTARWHQVYADILSGKTRGYSVMGVCRNVGKALVRWSMSSLAITPRPCLAEATFAIGTKAVKALLGDVPLSQEVEPPMTPSPMITSPIAEGGSAGVLTRPAFGHVMRIAQAHKDVALHDHLLTRPAYTHGNHDAGDCPICADMRGQMGMKASKDGPDGDYLVVEADGTQHLRVKVNGTPDHGLMGGAWAALHEGYRGNTYQGPDKAEALAKLKALYTAESMDTPEESSAAGQKAIDAAEAVIARYTAARKAGRRTSRKDTAILQGVIQTLQQLLAEEKAEEAEETAEGEPATP